MAPTDHIVALAEQVRATIKEDLGAYPEELYESIDREPIASASLAQVSQLTTCPRRRAVPMQPSSPAALSEAKQSRSRGPSLHLLPHSSICIPLHHHPQASAANANAVLGLRLA